MTVTQAAGSGRGGSNSGDASTEPRHLVRAFLVWLVLAGTLTPFIYFVLGPELAPGTMTTTAASQQFDMRILLTVAAPIMLIIYVWFGYNLIVFRVKGDDDESNGAYVKRDSIKLQVGWVLGTAVVVLCLFVFGTYELVVPAGAGGGEGASAVWSPGNVKEAAIWKPAPKPVVLQVQVIGQQWNWAYRWPQFGGMETTYLMLPVNTEIQFNVTSLDVIHSFWAYKLGVKADANPGSNNIAFTKATSTGNFEIRCSELCGIWHGAMIGPGSVASQSAFYAWAQSKEVAQAPDTKELPKFSLTYFPSSNGAGGGYYAGLTSP